MEKLNQVEHPIFHVLESDSSDDMAEFPTFFGWVLWVMLGPSQIGQAVILIPQIGRSCRWPRALTSLGQVTGEVWWGLGIQWRHVVFRGKWAQVVNHQLSDTSFDGKMWRTLGLLVCPQNAWVSK